MTLTVPETEISDLKKIINDLKNRIDNLEIQINYFNKSKNNQIYDKSITPILFEKGAAKHIITYIADDFDAPLEDFKEYM